MWSNSQKDWRYELLNRKVLRKMSQPEALRTKVKNDCMTQFGGSITLKIHHNSQNSIFHRALGETSKILNLSSRPSNLHSYAWDTYFYHGYVAWSYLHRFYY